MVGRSRDGRMEAFPVVETVHRESILHVVEAPAQLPEAGQRAAQAVAQRAVACLEGGRRYHAYQNFKQCVILSMWSYQGQSGCSVHFTLRTATSVVNCQNRSRACITFAG